MKRVSFLSGVLCFGLLAAPAGAWATLVEITYEVSQLASTRWSYAYTVHNQALPQTVEEFTIYFRFGLYENLAVETPDPPAGDWDELVIQPDPFLSDDGFYDALTKSAGIPVGESVAGFAVSFDWLGSGTPSPQYFEVVDPQTFQVIASGVTTPEPSSLLLLGALGVLASRRR